MPSKHGAKTVSLVLGAGAARGMVHIGVIRWLEEHGYQIRSISGCSIGALVGGIYAAGKLDEFESWVSAITRLDIFSLLDMAWQPGGLVKGDRIINHLTDLVGDWRIEDLPMDYTAVATDLSRRREVWINQGPLFDAIRASISMPLLFTPFRINEVDLVDGGVLNPIPIAPTFSDQTDMTIAVDLGGPEDSAVPEGVEHNAKTPVDSDIRIRIEQFVEQMVGKYRTPGKQDLAVFDVATESFELMQSAISRHKLAAFPPDEVIVFPRGICKALDFHRASELIELGYKSCENKLATHGLE